jgi:hypothetical protein
MKVLMVISETPPIKSGIARVAERLSNGLRACHDPWERVIFDYERIFECPPGAVVVAAAGNSGSSAPEYPAAEGFAGAIAVGASMITDTLASFSNYGAWVHVTAPGEAILSSVPGGEYGVWSATSMAAPLGAGAAALVRAADPDLDPSVVVKQILATSAQISGLVPLRIDVAAAIGLPAGKMFSGGDTTCTGALGAVTVDNLQVPPGQTCDLAGTRVQGNIKVEASATSRLGRGVCDDPQFDGGRQRSDRVRRLQRARLVRRQRRRPVFQQFRPDLHLQQFGRRQLAVQGKRTTPNWRNQYCRGKYGGLVRKLWWGTASIKREHLNGTKGNET